MKIVSANRAITNSELTSFEKYLGKALPMEYRQFLLKQNGGEPEPYLFRISKNNASAVQILYGLHPESSENDLEKIRPTFLDSLDPEFLCIGMDPGAAEICINLNDGGIYFWDKSDVGNLKTLTKISDSFNSFLNSLYDE